MADRTTRCFRCGRQTSSVEPACSQCGTCLLVDLVVDVPVLDSRALHLMAREIDALGGDAPVYSEIKKGLALLPGVLLSECNRSLAGRVAGVLRCHGVVTQEVPVRRPRGRIGTAAGPRIGGGVLATLTARIRRLPAKARLAIVGGIAVIVVLVLLVGGRDRGVDHQSEETMGQPRLMSSQEIAFAAIPACAQVNCGGTIGAGFFIAPDRLVTCAHLLSSSPSAIEVTLADGSTLLGTLEAMDAWLDLAIVRVEGADVAFLELGDGSVAEQGETVLAVGSPVGLGFSVSQGVVSHPSRVVMGISYLQIDAVAHPGNSGGPILDRGGRVIGVAAIPDANSSGVGLVVPVNYLWSGVPSLVSKEQLPEERSRWQALLERASLVEKDELAEVVSGDSGPALLSAALNAKKEVEVVVARFASAHPFAERFEFRIVDGEVEACDAIGEVGWWRPASEHDDEVDTSRYLSWLTRHDLLGRLFLGTCRLDLGGCSRSVAKTGVFLELVKGDRRADRVVIDANSWR